jgi:hypothetical protein
MKYLILFAFVFVANFSTAQSNYNAADFAQKPVWISMMDDENVNYFEALQAFDTYWKYHEKPEGESDMDVKKVTENKKRFSKKEIKASYAAAAMRMKIKKFNNWKEKMEPYVQDDGTILSPAKILNHNK